MADPGTIEALVEQVYAALATGDEAALLGALAPGFRAQFAEGMPAGGGRAEGREAARDHWWAIGRAFRARPEVEELVPCADGRLLVRGRYRGTARDGGGIVDAAFTHLWTAVDGALVALEQVTDTARWPASAPGPRGS
jgi:2-(1,2-epoxy-1,2-dihydrophenyl)acetyl-CoA isomerase